MFDSRFRATLLPSCALALAVLLSSQGNAQQAFATATTTTLSPDNLAWMPQGMLALSQQSSSHTDFSFDRSTLALVGNLSSLDQPTRQTIARLNGVALHLYRFPAQRGYDAAEVEAIRAQYGLLGWKHFSTSKPEPTPLGDGASRTDVWINTHGINVAGATILMTGPTTVNLIAVSGDLSTLDLLRLRGHFGIPRFPDDALPH